MNTFDMATDSDVLVNSSTIVVVQLLVLSLSLSLTHSRSLSPPLPLFHPSFINPFLSSGGYQLLAAKVTYQPLYNIILLL